ncbi:sugar transferase [bacterium (Candidatus Blackallbacteria) CG17_big_fil_post_rev_8_21_14_2_50_48_46]|uniref:Sugar transferase n=1 Tax=bacterium (Candidatus Blackallbacteria) CG17_big_fil_post_rev_8_21_14_2_50_48_46 TaxID=2014261 RepID=A0A2M7G803_9BACT|nr:MAG: sugar transferase [bacterium (Candidatus Blackallbacteria) CG18_big_fil_WC_8_21_14_2_50_49_26]PIW18212.1 MAG: sugar transferase [bacterium (Candidatus Blackallbacteria) CG17_big_fil_post_rev_8_21_14_2_50_48_46]PIW50643.1 MAG: sugar transferase [bacterium (Candidatus Blackallbacteria) CG13_big_fil_rev_8_21_14_2_50_49_14]
MNTESLIKPVALVDAKPYLRLKYSLDFCFALLMLLCMAPLLLCVALLIRLESKGPIFYLQTRVGLNETPFQIYKFRTMVAGADKIGPLLTETNDPRITRFGKLLRRTSIDELPQLLNILKGEMSFIGPRPEVPPIVADYTERQRGVFQVRPGLSGWAQVNGRDELDIPTKLNLDLEYIANLSLGMDFKILCLTPLAVLSKRGVN